MFQFSVFSSNPVTAAIHLNYPWLQSKFLLSPGALYLADQARAFWLVDAIACHQKDMQVAGANFQIWELVVSAGHALALTCTDEYCQILVKQEIPQANFPREPLLLYAIQDKLLGGRMLMLSSEYIAADQFTLQQEYLFSQVLQPALVA